MVQAQEGARGDRRGKTDPHGNFGIRRHAFGAGRAPVGCSRDLASWTGGPDAAEASGETCYKTKARGTEGAGGQGQEAEGSKGSKS